MESSSMPSRARARSGSLRPVSGLGASPRWMSEVWARPSTNVVNSIRPGSWMTKPSPRFWSAAMAPSPPPSGLRRVQGLVGVFVLVFGLFGHHRGLDRCRLLRRVAQRLEVALVRLLVEEARPDVALGG